MGIVVAFCIAVTVCIFILAGCLEASQRKGAISLEVVLAREVIENGRQ